MQVWKSRTSFETVTGRLRETAGRVPDSLYLDFSGQRYSYGDVWARATELARGFRKAGVEPGQTVVSMLDNNVDGVAAWFGANLVGAVWVGINTALKGEFLRHVVTDTGARVAICEPDFVERFARIEAHLPDLELLLVRPGGDPAELSRVAMGRLDDYRLAGSGSGEGWHEATPDDVSCLVYTGGTTGPSKGCVISHGYAISAARAFLAQSGRAPDEVNFSPLPMFHFNLVSCTLLGTMLLSSSAAIAPRFSVSRFWPEVERTGARIVNVLGAMGTLLSQMPDTPEMARCHGQIRLVHGSPFPPDLQRAWRERFGVERVGSRTYGLTEAFPLSTMKVDEVGPPGSSGRRNQADFDVRVFGPGDVELPPGEVGEVVCRPCRPNVMFQGYWRRPEATTAVTGNLWFHTGDLGRFDEDGWFFFADRKKDYLRRRGENISSQEMEATYLRHPGIDQVAVHAVLSELTEDEVKVTAVLAVGASLTPEDLFEWSKDHVPYFALPRYVEFREELPTSAVGRVHKYQLRDEGCTEATWDRERSGATWERR